jgi:hypothetical protein
MLPATTAAVIEDRIYTVTPAALTVTGGMVTAEFTAMKVTERVEQESGRVASAARLTARLVLRNNSSSHTVRLVGAKLTYIDDHGQPIGLEDGRPEPVLKFSRSERLDPGQETVESLGVDFPAEALKAKRLAQIRLELAYIPSPYREETMNFAVRITETK